MPSLVERAREVISAESDDFFQPDTILYYLNKSQDRVIAWLIRNEQDSGKSLRALDNLRKYKDLSVNGLTFTDQGDYWTAQVTFPTGADSINQFAFVKYATKGVMRELTQNNRIKLEWGNLSPSDSEAYYMITQDDSDNVVFEIFVDSDDSATSNNLRVYYIKNPTKLTTSDNTLEELPSRLENAVIYGAAKLMVSQESVNDQVSQKAFELFQNTYNEELQANSY